MNKEVDYSTQINKEKGFRTKRWNKNTDLANLSRSSLFKGAGHKNLREDRYG